jgi:molybdate transport system substrate-binding protein
LHSGNWVRCSSKVLFNFGSSGQLAQQIESGAPVDVFVSANTGFVEKLEQHGFILPETTRPYARGRLTLWTRTDSPLRLRQLEDVTRSEVRRIAIANPTHAPYGMAAREALQSIGIWEQIQPKLVMGENVRQTLQYAATGNVEAAIVARSLSVQHEGRWVLIPEALHRPIVQALGVVTQTQHEPQARQFVAFVTAPQGQAVLRKYGFDTPTRELHP